MDPETIGELLAGLARLEQRVQKLDERIDQLQGNVLEIATKSLGRATLAVGGGSGLVVALLEMGRWLLAR